MNNRSNRKLYYYGIFAVLKQMAGMMLMFLSVIIGLIFGITNHGIIGLIFFLIFGAAGLYLLITGKAQRFDYKRQSGTIIHRGDWR
jgi:MFS-type transporter involved in bile tolerance (Atg22 family)